MSKLSRLMMPALALMLLIAAGGAGAAAPAIARPDPLSSIVGVGDLVTVKLYVQDVADLYGADIKMALDPTVLEAQDAEAGVPGIQIRPLGELLQPGFVIKRVACNEAIPDSVDCPTAGRVWFAVTQLNPTPPASGSGGVAAITFRALKEGVSNLTITSQKFADRQGLEIPSIGQSGSITVSAGDLTFRAFLPMLWR